ncbi:DUF4344 domain-containing metallopeptidase [Dongia sedimenti]|uniref:DUF4344 domain-containing metallopeptidase n=1 Tax=Dongia sedimenti TaxID=3064282 RepID=A0ABU0YND0_9PROT|nr:DUF4344 domain-containing metallopeptidase [Rhodospirillaceae bacterium R-7]
MERPVIVNACRLMRRLSRFLPALVVAASIGTAFAQSDAATEEESDPVTDYFVGNLLFVFYHELGHGLIHKLDLPVLGREEDAADQLATLMLMDAGTDSVGGEPVLTAALGWLDSWKKRDGEAEESDYWDEHSLDLQRYANIVCLVYGSDPDSYKNLVAEWDLPADRAERCPNDFYSAAASWNSVMDGVWVTEEQPAPADNRSFTLEVEPAQSEETREIAHYVAEQQVFEGLIESMNQNMILPAQIKVVARDCGEENAYYDPETSEITMCYEWLATFMADAEKQAE